MFLRKTRFILFLVAILVFVSAIIVVAVADSKGTLDDNIEKIADIVAMSAMIAVVLLNIDWVVMSFLYVMGIYIPTDPWFTISLSGHRFYVNDWSFLIKIGIFIVQLVISLIVGFVVLVLSPVLLPTRLIVDKVRNG